MARSSERVNSGILDRGVNKRTGEQTYLVRVVVGTLPNGRRKYYCQTVHGGIREAQKVYRELASKRDQGKLEHRAKGTVNEYLDSWLKTHKTAVKERTYLNDVEMLDRYIRPHLGTKKLASLKPMTIQAAYAELQTQGLSPSTVRRAHAVLRNALKWAVQWQMIQTNPAENVVLPKSERPEFHVLTPEEAKRFLDSCGFDKYGLVFQFMLFTGCRPGEALALRWKDVDLDRMTVAIRRTYGKKAGRELISSPKTKSGTRTVPILDPEAVAELKSRRSKLMEESLANGRKFDQDAFIFVSDKGTPLDARNLIQRHFKPILEHAGIDSRMRMYDLRHSTATLLLTLDVHPKVVQEMLGHADIKLTMDTYTHVLPSLQKNAAKKLSDLLSSNS